MGRRQSKVGKRGGMKAAGTSLASGRKAESSHFSPKLPSLTPELNNFTKHTNKEEQLRSALINNL